MYQESINQPSQTIAKSKAFNFHWEKRHWILIIGLVCLVLWYFAPQLKSTPWLQSGIALLPTIGGLIFATDSILKLAF